MSGSVCQRCGFFFPSWMTAHDCKPAHGGFAGTACNRCGTQMVVIGSGPLPGCPQGVTSLRCLACAPEPRPTSEPGVGDQPPAMLGDERREEPVDASSSSPVLVPMDAERIAALREMLDDQVESSANSALCGGTVPEKWLRHERVLRTILRDAGADE